MRPPALGPQSSLRAFAETISSASDPELAAWQEEGLAAPPGRGGSLLVWAVLVSSAAVGLGCGAAAWLIVWHSVGALSRPATLAAAPLQDPGLLLLLGGLLVVLLAAAVSFALFQGLSRLARAVQRPRDP
jgi:hypothetical protein